jgi:hypothetical protein
MTALPPEAYAIVEGRHPDPFHYLGLHAEDDRPVVRVFLPDAADVAVVDEEGRASSLRRIHAAGLFVNQSPELKPRNRFPVIIRPNMFPPGFLCMTITGRSGCRCSAPATGNTNKSPHIIIAHDLYCVIGRTEESAGAAIDLHPESSEV